MCVLTRWDKLLLKFAFYHPPGGNTVLLLSWLKSPCLRLCGVCLVSPTSCFLQHLKSFSREFTRSRGLCLLWEWSPDRALKEHVRAQVPKRLGKKRRCLLLLRNPPFFSNLSHLLPNKMVQRFSHKCVRVNIYPALWTGRGERGMQSLKLENWESWCSFCHWWAEIRMICVVKNIYKHH